MKNMINLICKEGGWAEEIYPLIAVFLVGRDIYTYI